MLIKEISQLSVWESIHWVSSSGDITTDHLFMLSDNNWRQLKQTIKREATTMTEFEHIRKSAVDTDQDTELIAWLVSEHQSIKLNLISFFFVYEKIAKRVEESCDILNRIIPQSVFWSCLRMTFCQSCERRWTEHFFCLLRCLRATHNSKIEYNFSFFNVRLWGQQTSSIMYEILTENSLKSPHDCAEECFKLEYGNENFVSFICATSLHPISSSKHVLNALKRLLSFTIAEWRPQLERGKHTFKREKIE